MPIIEKYNVKYFTFDLFKDNGFFKHCYSTRIGGVSKGRFSAMNLGYNRGDDNENVTKNYKLLAKAIGVGTENMVCTKQVHGNQVKVVTKADIGKGFEKERDFGDFDGFITADRGVCLTTFYADCVPVYFADFQKKIIGVSHAGWRGTVNNIVGNTIKKMVDEFNCNPKDIYVGIGPSIGQCCFEVDAPVYNEFIEKLPECIKFITKNDEKYNIDLQQINKFNAVKSGVLSQNIEIANLCTMCNPDLFFSHRKMGSERGTQAGFIEMAV